MTDRVRRNAKPFGILGGSGLALALLYRMTVAIEGMETSLETRLTSIESKVINIEHGVDDLHHMPVEVAEIKTMLKERK